MFLETDSGVKFKITFPTFSSSVTWLAVPFEVIS
jgi:hypothetical protein